jgi:hypothetical protein
VNKLVCIKIECSPREAYIRLRNEYALLIRDEAWMQAPRSDEEFATIIIRGHSRWGEL